LSWRSKGGRSKQVIDNPKKELKIRPIFGASAGYSVTLQKAGVKPRKEYDLKPLKALLSTGSPLS
jgi:acyl-coenzyme A synthetase/AMP-(fatty) acid ligase